MRLTILISERKRKTEQEQNYNSFTQHTFWSFHPNLVIKVIRQFFPKIKPFDVFCLIFGSSIQQTRKKERSQKVAEDERKKNYKIARSYDVRDQNS